MAWNPPFVLLLILSTLIDWLASRQIFATPSRQQKKIWLIVSLLSNFGLLAFFKYGNFIIGNLNLFLPNPIDPYSIILPVGISFYTFQTVSYTIDVYRGQERPSASFLDFALYVTFFPQLVAGPIVRSGEFLNQCSEEKKFSWDAFGYGIFWLVVGLFLKVVVADHFLAPVTEQVYSLDKPVGTLSAWIATLAFSGQILCDFSGYSICAIGVAQLLGFYLPKNFRFPYASVGFSDFWRRWHITLSSWLRDYLYIPLGGNRQGEWQTYRNLMLTMLMGGLWHGASWTFVVWGGLHGLFLSAERACKGRFKATWVPDWVRVAGVFILVSLTWVFFRATSFAQAWQILSAMAGVAGEEVIGGKEVVIVSGITVCMLGCNYLWRDSDLEQWVRQAHWATLAVVLAVFTYSIMTLAGEDRSFIYFQF